MTPEELLTHAGFIKSLTRGLIGDKPYADAEDVEQKVWVAVLERPHVKTRSPRSWLSSVIHNISISLHRRETRRRKHEKAMVTKAPSTTTEVMTPEKLAIRKEALRNLTDIVLSLEEPYLSTILLRFYEDQPAREIAEMTGVSRETVKTRLHRGLNRLRKMLDTEYGGRLKWCLILAPIAGMQISSTAAAAALTAGGGAAAGTAAGASSWSSGFAALSTWLKAGLVAAALVGAAAGIFILVTDSDEDKKNAPPGSAAIAPSENLPSPLRPARNDEDLAPSGARASGAGREPLARSHTFVSGLVTDARTDAPVRAYDFRMWRQAEGAEWKLILHETVRDPEGHFRFPLEKGGLYNLVIASSGHVLKPVQGIEVPDRSGLSDLRIALDPGLSVSGRVVEDFTNRPVAGAIVGPAIYAWETDLTALHFLGFDEACVHTRTDAEGRFTLRGLRENDTRIAAVHPDFAEGSVDIAPGADRSAEIRLVSGFRIRGKALDDRGEPASDVLIRLYGEEIPVAIPVKTAEDGCFVTPPVRPGRVVVKAGDPPPEFSPRADFTGEFKFVAVEEGDVAIEFGPSQEHVLWCGTLYDSHGATYANVPVMVTPAHISEKEAFAYNLVRRVPCGKKGRFEIGKLLPGRYRVELSLAGQPQLNWGIVAFEEPGRVEQNIDLSLDSVIAGTVVSQDSEKAVTGKKGYIWAWQGSGELLKYSATLDSAGRFEIEGVKPGGYFIQARVGDRYSERLVGVKVEKQKPVDDLVLAIALLGGLRIKLEGFEGDPQAIFSLSLLNAASGKKSEFGKQSIGEKGKLERSFSLEAGSWTLSLAFEDLGYMERSFEVFPDRTTELLVRRDEIALYGDFISLAGSLVRTDGSPLSGIAMILAPDDVAGLSGERLDFEAATDEDGRFMIDGLKPGRWLLTADLSPECRVHFPEIWIPAETVDFFRLDLVLPSGRVSGFLSDASSGLPIVGDRHGSWKVYLLEVDREEYVGVFSGGTSGSGFDIDGVPAGEYQVLIRAERFENFRSRTIRLDETQAHDLGEIRLAPCGVVDLEVVDPLFQPVEEFTVVCNGREIAPTRLVGSGKKRFDKLPAGSVELLVSATGFNEQTIEIRTDPGQPVDARVILIPE